MAQVARIGNSLFALIPAFAARQLFLTKGSPLVVLLFEDEIRIRNANAPRAKSSPSGKRSRSKLVVPAEEPW